MAQLTLQEHRCLLATLATVQAQLVHCSLQHLVVEVERFIVDAGRRNAAQVVIHCRDQAHAEEQHGRLNRHVAQLDAAQEGVVVARTRQQAVHARADGCVVPAHSRAHDDAPVVVQLDVSGGKRAECAGGERRELVVEVRKVAFRGVELQRGRGQYELQVAERIHELLRCAQHTDVVEKAIHSSSCCFTGLLEELSYVNAEQQCRQRVALPHPLRGLDHQPIAATQH